MAAAFEFDDRPGPVRDAVVKQHQRMQTEIARSVQMCVETGEFAADTDAKQFAFEILGIANAFYFSHRLMREKDATQRAFTAFDRLVRDALANPSASTATGSDTPSPPRAA
jgi:hypothetical protein